MTLAERIYYFNGPAQAGFSASETGVVSYEKLAAPSRVAWLDRAAGKSRRSLSTASSGPPVSRPTAAPSPPTSGTRRWARPTSGSTTCRAGCRCVSRSAPSDDQTPVWSADGARIFFRGDQFGPPDIWAIPSSSPGRESLFFRRNGVQHPDDVSPDGRFLVFTEWSRKTNGDLWLLPLAEGAQPTPLEQGPYFEAGARFSPDGRSLAYVSGEAGTLEIYVRPLEGSGERIRVSATGGRMPRWRRDGKELFYVAPNGDLMAVPIRPGARPEPGNPSVLFRLEGEVRDYDVDASGQRFLVDLAPTERAPIGVIVNWPTLAGPATAP